MRASSMLAFVVLQAACSSFGVSPAEERPASPSDGGASDGGARDDAASVPTTADDGGARQDAASGCAGRCIDFESNQQQTPPFGFDDFVGSAAAKLTIGPSSPNALSAGAIGNDDAYGVVRIANTPASVRVRAKVRRGSSIAGTATSTHVFDIRCLQPGMTVAAKLEFDGELGTQINGQSQSEMADPLDVGQWVELDLLTTFSVNTVKATLTRHANGATATAESTLSVKCNAGISVQVGSHLYTGSGEPTGEYEVSFDDILIDWN